MIVAAKLKAKAGEEAKMEEALRGLVKNVAQEEGTLMLPITRLPMQGVVQTWRQACGQIEKWNDSHNSKSISEEKLQINAALNARRAFCQRDEAGNEIWL